MFAGADAALRTKPVAEQRALCPSLKSIYRQFEATTGGFVGHFALGDATERVKATNRRTICRITNHRDVVDAVQHRGHDNAADQKEDDASVAG